MVASISPRALKEALHDGGEIALLDVREHGQFGESHLFYAVPLPYSRLELDIARLVPRRDVRCVVYDSGEADSFTETFGYFASAADWSIAVCSSPFRNAIDETPRREVNRPTLRT